jgi:hypothetical protein
LSSADYETATHSREVEGGAGLRGRYPTYRRLDVIREGLNVAQDTRRTGGRTGTASTGSRGQTTLDFAVGVSIFLLALTSVLLFIPGTISPFVDGGQEEIVTANRVADSLSEGLLGDPKTPHVLNETCTQDFFEGASSDCRFTGNNLTERIGVRNTQLVNVSIQSNVSASDSGNEVLCWTSGDNLIERDEGSCDVVAAAGSTPPARSGTTVAARRVIDLNGTDATLVVEMW